ncbi:gamma-glutamylcyclotransferase family protein [Noviherbaspirillum galbum]|uniref:Putative gamma-glutamylcyclotransferase n=1 Tax=Noviherbaspirillum galbum TaxID=2709383 RepID=A0A6B3SRX5_9BURK|nr:gamma-glutamylcyclotransferase family protein [Noviherbaspirillum galbum]NEX63268.1 gamma-glutamylcyclotransferase [Noviherbaspirillum galbum]
MSMHVFTYGSLMFSPVWERVVRGSYEAEPAVLSGHVRHAILGETYPGMIASPGSEVAGMLYRGVSDADVAALDAFEGVEYRRVAVQVAAGGRPVEAQTYLYLMPDRLSADPWVPERFEMARFLGTYCVDKLGS